MLYFKISLSLIPLKCFTIARKEFPWATTITFLCSKIVGQIVSCQKGSTRSTVVFNDSVFGRASAGKD